MRLPHTVGQRWWVGASALWLRAGCLFQEILDQAALPLTRHRLADDLARRLESEVCHFRTEVGGGALRLRALAVLARLLGVPQALLDPLAALGEHPADGAEAELPQQCQQQDEVERSDDDPEQVDLEARPGLRLRRQGSQAGVGSAAGEG